MDRETLPVHSAAEIEAALTSGPEGAALVRGAAEELKISEDEVRKLIANGLVPFLCLAARYPQIVPCSPISDLLIFISQHATEQIRPVVPARDSVLEMVADVLAVCHWRGVRAMRKLIGAKPAIVYTPYDVDTATGKPHERSQEHQRARSFLSVW